MMNEELNEIQTKLLTAETIGNISTVDKNGKSFSYISWADAWRVVLKICPDANYEVVTFDGKPYLKQEEGYIVETKVTIGGITRSMWLPVMDSHNKAMKDQPYEIKTKNGSIPVPSATMTDVNKAIMRCLVKNIAMFGYGLNVYQGDDTPDAEEIEYVKPQVRCEGCGEIIADVQRKDGSILRAESLIENSRSMYHKALCAKCVAKEQRKLNEQKGESNNG